MTGVDTFMNNDAEHKIEIREYWKRWPRFYYVVALLCGPVFKRNTGPRWFLQQYEPKGPVLNVGSGPRRIAPEVQNIDSTAYEGVDIVADICALPYAEEDVGAIICDNVLEHVPTPTAAVLEMKRVLRKGGLLYVVIPFVYPFHGSPGDHTRWPHSGYSTLLEGFVIEEQGVRAGPFFALVCLLSYLCASLLSFGSQQIFWICVHVFMVLLIPLKLLDVIGAYLTFADYTAATLYCVARKE